MMTVTNQVNDSERPRCVDSRRLMVEGQITLGWEVPEDTTMDYGEMLVLLVAVPTGRARYRAV